jgi:hypothetical protein
MLHCYYGQSALAYKLLVAWLVKQDPIQAKKLPPNPSLASFLNRSLWLTFSNALEKSVSIASIQVYAIFHAV